MNKFKYYFILLLAGVTIVSCKKSDDDDIVLIPLRDYQEQYNVDNANIEEYLNTYYFTVTQSPGNQTDQDVTFTKITDPASQPSIMSYLNSASYPKLLRRDIDLHGILYKTYYLVLREGTGTSPMNTDAVLTAYKGEYLTRVEKTAKDPEYVKTTQFEEVKFPQSPLDLFGTIMGWSELFPQFKTGDSSTNPDGSAKYDNFGAGVLFLPSGLGYYASPPGASNIPAYAPLIFSIKLYSYKRMDHEYNVSNGVIIPNPDGVYDYQEDLNHDGYVRDYRNTTLYPNKPVNPDDTDGDGIPDFLDQDDDGDGYSTRFEITKPSYDLDPAVSGLSKYYPYDPVPDNPATPNVDETERHGIPAFSASGEIDYKSPGRIRIHVDKDHHSAKP